MRSLALATGMAGLTMLGCASLPGPSWRVQPTYVVEGGVHAVPGYLALARQYEGEGRHAQALDAYRRAAEALPTDADLQNALGLAHARNGQFGPAVAALRRAVALAPERAQLLNNLGYALLLDGRAEEARAMFRLTLAVDPGHVVASRNLGYVDLQLARVALPTEPALVDMEAAAGAPNPALASLAQATAALAPPVVASTPVAVVASQAAEATTRPALRLHGVSIEIVNGNGISGAAARLRQLLRDDGIPVGRLANRVPYDSLHTTVLYRAGKADLAREVVLRIPVRADVALAPPGSTRADLSVLLGHDMRRAAGCAVLDACGKTSGPLASAGGTNHRVPAGSQGE